MKFSNHCIVFLFTFYIVLQSFGNGFVCVVNTGECLLGSEELEIAATVVLHNILEAD